MGISNLEAVQLNKIEVLEGKNRVYVLTSIATKNIAQVNININLKISRRVNANASPDVAKPLYQREGGCASFPLIQSFACTDSARALRRTGSARALRRHNLEG